MYIKVKQYSKVVWIDMGHPSINNSVAFQECTELISLKSDVIPRIGETVVVGDQSFKVDDVIYHYEHMNTTASIYSTHVEIIAKPEILYVDYMKYIRTFTHCMDNRKADVAYSFIPPTSMKEWKDDIKDMESLHFILDMEKMKNRRCKLRFDL